MIAELLSQQHLSVITRDADDELAAIQDRLEHKILVDGRADLEAALCSFLDQQAAPAIPRTLDLIGHTTADRSLLVLGDWTIDATSPIVTAFFRGLADAGVLERLGVHALRLLGCSSAMTDHGRWTITKLADVLGVEVYGTTGPMFASHYDRTGLAHERRYLLTSASELRARTPVTALHEVARSYVRMLDLDGLPSSTLPATSDWSIRIADRDDARAILRMVQRGDGSVIASLRSDPLCTVALPAAAPGLYHLVDVLLDGEVVRTHPTGSAHGIVYPVETPAELRRLIDELPDHRTTQRKPSTP